MIEYGENHFDSDFYGYINGDILVSNKIESILSMIQDHIDHHLLKSKVRPSSQAIHPLFRSL